MKAILFFTALVILTFIRVNDLQNNTGNSSAGYFNCNVFVPVDDKATNYSHEDIKWDASAAKCEPETNVQNSMQSSEALLPGKSFAYLNISL